VLRPNDAELAAYRQGGRTWASLPWPQDLYGSQFGLRQNQCLLELQLRPGPTASHDAASAVPYFAPLVVYFPVKPNSP
jgi:hypothetical protein